MAQWFIGFTVFPLNPILRGIRFIVMNQTIALVGVGYGVSFVFEL